MTEAQPADREFASKSDDPFNSVRSTAADYEYDSSSDGTSSFIGLMALATYGRRTLIGGALGLAFLVGAISLVLPKKYTTSIAFYPVQTTPSVGSAGGLSSLAGGLGLLHDDPTTSPDFYADLLSSRDISEELVTHRYGWKEGTDSVSGSILDLYEINESTPGKSIDEAIRILHKDLLKVEFNRQTSVISVDVTTKWPELSQQLAREILAVLEDYNLNNRKKQGESESRFLRSRVDSARMDLHRAEDGLQSFLQHNRSYQADPSLLFEFQRLQREVALRQDVYGVLTQSYEQARISAVRNTPTVSLVQSPRLALRFDRRFIALRVVIAAIVGFVLALAWLLGRQALSDARDAAPSNEAHLSAIVDELQGDLKRLAIWKRNREG